MTYDNLNHFKSVAAHQFFIAPADNDYLLARWMLLNGFSEFHWHASQAIEKYLKAGLVLNGVPTTKLSHELGKIYFKHCDIFKDQAFTTFVTPHDINRELWRDEEVNSFIDRTAYHGSPDSRYGLISTARNTDDLFKLDQLCWALRRLAIGLDWVVGADYPNYPSLNEFIDKTYGEALVTDPDVLPRGLIRNLEVKLPEIAQTRGDLLHSWNFSFRRNDEDLTKKAPPQIAPKFGPFTNSYLFLYWQVLTSKNDKGKLDKLEPVFKEGMEWLVASIRLPRETKAEIIRMLNANRSQ